VYLKGVTVKFQCLGKKSDLRNKLKYKTSEVIKKIIFEGFSNYEKC